MFICTQKGSDFQTTSILERKLSNASSNSSFDSTLNDNPGSTRSATGSSILSVKSSSNNKNNTSLLSSSSVANTGGVSASLKRKRKNRTAFTANQIFELEKRFSNQRYLSPHDRDRIAYELSLSTAQVITWFQNRRAKQKRDQEEMKNDVNAAKSVAALDPNLDVEKILKSDTLKYQYSNFNGEKSKHTVELSDENSFYCNTTETDNESYATDEEEYNDNEEDEDEGVAVKKNSLDNSNIKSEIAGHC